MISFDPENPHVGGSIPPLATILRFAICGISQPIAFI